MEKHIKWSAFLIFCFSLSLFAMDKPGMVIGSDNDIDEAAYLELIRRELVKKRVLLVFFDENKREAETDAVAWSVLSALYQDVGPILVSNAILNNIIKSSENDERSTDEIKDAIMQATEANKKDQNVLLCRVCFKPEKWIIKRVNDSLSFMLSKKSLTASRIDLDRVNEYMDDADLVSDIELRLGLRVNHFKTIDIHEIARRRIEDGYADYSVDALKPLFCKKRDYISQNMAIREWSIFMLGHGSFNKTIVGIPLDIFQGLLGLFSNYINTQLLSIQSCFSTGVNAKKIYEETPFGLQKQYSFPIMAIGFNDTSTTGRQTYADPKYGRVLAPQKSDPRSKDSLSKGYVFSKEELNYMFYEEPQELEQITDWASVLQHGRSLSIDYRAIAKILSTGLSQDTPQIKLSGMEWFSVMETDAKIISIGSILGQTRDPQKPLDIKTYFKKDPASILLRTDDIPFELKLTHLTKLEHIISMVSSGPMIENPNLVVHRIKKISLPTPIKYTTTDKPVLQWLQLFELSGVTRGAKMFFVEEFEDKKNLIIFGIPTEPGEVLMKAYFEDKNNEQFTTQFKWHRKSENIIAKRIIPGSDDERDYLEKIRLATIEYPQAKEAYGIKRVTPELTQKIQDVYSELHIAPGPRGKRMYEELRK